MSKTYDDSFFQQHAAGSLASARAILSILFRYCPPQSVIDVGCGLGTWLKAATELGAAEILGLDGDYVDRGALLIPERCFVASDLRQRISAERRFDLAISMEVAEHLPYERSATFVEDLVALSDIVLFSAALPYQGGTDHINEQWLEFWAILFKRHGYLPCDFLRRECWGNPSVEFWYSQNTIVFCTEEHARTTFPREFLAAGRPLSYPHPLTFLVNVARFRPFAAAALELECEDYHNVLLAYQQGAEHSPALGTASASDGDGGLLFPKSRMLLADAHAEIARKNTEIAQKNEDIAHRNRVTVEKNAQIELLTRQVSELRAEVKALRTSLSWRLTELPRRWVTWLTGFSTAEKKP